jgi:hypothetical protein
MTRFPLTTQPQQKGVSHSVEIVTAEPTEESALRISNLFNRPIATRSNRCPVCGAVFIIPEGNLKELIRAHLPELVASDAYITLSFHHGGHRPSTSPSGTTKVSVDDYQRLKESGKLRLNSETNPAP